MSDCVCLALAYCAKSSGARTNEPFFTMRRLSQKTNKVTVCFIKNSHVNFVIKYTAVALALGTSHYSSHSARSGFVPHSWAEKQVEKTRGQGAGASDKEAAQEMGGWTNDAAKGAMRMLYDLTTSAY